jgi:hypothetical protein
MLSSEWNTNKVDVSEGSPEMMTSKELKIMTQNPGLEI